jgi:hypothetical protein
MAIQSRQPLPELKFHPARDLPKGVTHTLISFIATSVAYTQVASIHRQDAVILQRILRPAGLSCHALTHLLIFFIGAHSLVSAEGPR